MILTIPSASSAASLKKGTVETPAASRIVFSRVSDISSTRPVDGLEFFFTEVPRGMWTSGGVSALSAWLRMIGSAELVFNELWVEISKVSSSSLKVFIELQHYKNIRLVHRGVSGVSQLNAVPQVHDHDGQLTT